MNEPILTVTATEMDGVTVLTAVGEIDHDSSGMLAAAAPDPVPGRLVIDLTGVTFCDSGGLSLFLDLHKRAAANGGQVRLAGAPDAVLAIMRTTNLDRILALYRTVADAVHDPSSAS
jgi:anti-anti-sigma factor